MPFRGGDGGVPLQLVLSPKVYAILACGSLATITNGHLLFVMGTLMLLRVQKCKVRQVTKDVVKSEV